MKYPGSVGVAERRRVGKMVGLGDGDNDGVKTSVGVVVAVGGEGMVGCAVSADELPA